MARRGASITQADVARIIRAAKQEGVAAIEVRVGETTVIVRISGEPKTPDFELAPGKESVL